jgi:hypothetical protein
VKQAFNGETASGDLKTVSSAPGTVQIEDQKIACRVQQLESVGPAGKTVSTIYFSDTLAPYVLRRTSVTTDAEGRSVLGETSVDVVALDMPCKVLSEVKNAAQFRIVQKSPKGAITTWAVTVPEVPGGVVAHSSKETDVNGRLIRRSTLELVGYGLQHEEERMGLFGRKRPIRIRKPPLRSPSASD